MSAPNKKKSLLARIFRGRKSLGPYDPAKDREYFKGVYERFRQILIINDDGLKLISEIEDKLLGQSPFSLPPMFERIDKCLSDVALMVKNLNDISDDGYRSLNDSLASIGDNIRAELASRSVERCPTVVSLDELRAPDWKIVGAKMANLGELKTLGYAIPDGFVLTVDAFGKFLDANGLAEKARRLESFLDVYNPTLLEKAARELRDAVMAADVPAAIIAEAEKAFDALQLSEGETVAARSSAIREDSGASHAGQYHTELFVARSDLAGAYKSVVASLFRSEALLYRYERGLNDGENEMAVGFMKMLEPRVSGVAFSREFNRMSADSAVISAKKGLSTGITGGTTEAEELLVTGDRVEGGAAKLLTHKEALAIKELARALEKHFGAAQDVEWAIDRNGAIEILQSRPMTMMRGGKSVTARGPIAAAPILNTGYVACPGAGAGRVYHVKKDSDLDFFPEGAVLVARHSSPSFSKVMNHCSAIVTEIGSPIGHMAILAREYGVPCVVGMTDALAILEPGAMVTVDASTHRVYPGEILRDIGESSHHFPLAGSPVVERMRKVARFVTPLNLTDPKSREFAPSKCKTIHDMTRFVHEKVYEVMFKFGDRAGRIERHSFRLDAKLPFEIRVLDVGGGVAEGKGADGAVSHDDLTSVPLKSFLEGMADERIARDKPRAVSARGFMSVIAEGMIAPPPEARGMASGSFAVVSDRYMNFSTRAGYHFSTVDVWCGQSQNKNYIHFRFEKGGATMDRRLRRVKFISDVLAALDFKVQAQGDFLFARLDKYEHEFIKSRLVDLGRLTMCARQLDMLMDSDSKAAILAKAFLNREFDKF